MFCGVPHLFNVLAGRRGRKCRLVGSCGIRVVTTWHRCIAQPVYIVGGRLMGDGVKAGVPLTDEALTS
jgi:hypothetical protein